MNRKTENLVSVVKGLRNELAELKGVQKMGYDVISLVENSTSASYDFTIGDYGYLARRLTLTVEHQKKPVGRVVAQVWRGSVGTPATTGSFRVVSIFNNFLSTEGKIDFTINAYNDATGTIYVKLWCLASDNGTVTIGSV